MRHRNTTLSLFHDISCLVRRHWGLGCTTYGSNVSHFFIPLSPSEGSRNEDIQYFCHVGFICFVGLAVLDAWDGLGVGMDGCMATSGCIEVAPLLPAPLLPVPLRRVTRIRKIERVLPFLVFFVCV